MTLADDLLNAGGNLRRHPLRTVLSVLGICIGVAATLAMVAVGEGAKRDLMRRIDSLGANLIVVLAEKPHRGRSAGERAGISRLSASDAAAIAAQIPEVAAAAAVLSLKLRAIHGNRNRAVRVQGVTASFFRVRHWSVVRGTAFMASDYRSADTVALLGRTAAERLFPDQDPVGESLRLGRTRFTVVGVLAAKGQNLQGRDQDDVILVPLRSAQLRLLGRRRVDRTTVTAILVSVTGKSWMPRAREAIVQLLRQRHRSGIHGRGDDFSVHDLTEIAETRRQAEGVFQGFLLIVTAISLLVGGIGIMNIMLVAVSERRREIGLRLAVGATTGDIRRQFLTEAALMTAAGGVPGVFAGMVTAAVIGRVTGWPIGFSFWAVAGVLLFCVCLGICFGLYPAIRAARLDPIQAIHHE